MYPESTNQALSLKSPAAATPIHSILVAEDDVDLSERLVRAFERFGHLTRSAHSIDAAKRIIAEHRPSHAVIDLRLGAESGLDLVSYAVSECQCRVVLLTGYGSIATALEAVRRGAINYLSKPVGVAQILSALEGEPLEPAAGPSPEVETPSLARVEWDHIQRVVRESNGNITHAARRLGLHRQALQRKLRQTRPV
jgi:two-component system response regulator RegA